ncbi:MAG: bifunctional phosphoglucose/phosphomannose isomerase, partial [Candidatus Cloacimonetes bacterium]|nr:bifunctional phosphoglucose/phosphomannose isomerase [Candidatus Cloacimonadota bacterium]
DNAAAITSGGDLKALVDGRYPWIELPDGYPPRSAVGYLFFGLLRLLEQFGVIPNQEAIVKRLLTKLETMKEHLSFNGQKNPAMQVASLMKDKIPLIYAGNPRLAALAYRWKCQINENAKYPAFFHVFSEMNHNEIEGWESTQYDNLFLPVLLTVENDEPPYRKRIGVFKTLLEKKEVPYIEFVAEGETVIEQFFQLGYTGDMISYYLGLAVRVNPTTINYIMFLKEELAKQGVS